MTFEEVQEIMKNFMVPATEPPPSKYYKLVFYLPIVPVPFTDRIMLIRNPEKVSGLFIDLVQDLNPGDGILYIPEAIRESMTTILDTVSTIEGDRIWLSHEIMDFVFSTENKN